MSINFIIVNNVAEHTKVMEWCESQNKRIGSVAFIRDYPIGLCVQNDVIGWTPHMDRAASYIEFKEWLKSDECLSAMFHVRSEQ